ETWPASTSIVGASPTYTTHTLISTARVAASSFNAKLREALSFSDFRSKNVDFSTMRSATRSLASFFDLHKCVILELHVQWQNVQPIKRTQIRAKSWVGTWVSHVEIAILAALSGF